MRLNANARDLSLDTRRHGCGRSPGDIADDAGNLFRRIHTQTCMSGVDRTAHESYFDFGSAALRDAQAEGGWFCDDDEIRFDPLYSAREGSPFHHLLRV
jgi:hypothetical protein